MKKPWFHSQFDGIGLCLPLNWQGWAVLSAGIVGLLLSVLLLHATYRYLVFFFILISVWVTIRVKREG